MRAGQLYRQIAFDQEPLTLGVEDGLLDVLAGKGLDRFRKSQKLTLTNSAGWPASSGSPRCRFQAVRTNRIVDTGAPPAGKPWQAKHVEVPVGRR
jgi:hypothetical protein